LLFTIASPRSRPSLREASFRLGVEVGALDAAFGVTLIDPRKGLYAVMVDERAAAVIGATSVDVDGPFSNPGIGTFGPPEPKKA
jgi:hypothetical protein